MFCRAFEPLRNNIVSVFGCFYHRIFKGNASDFGFHRKKLDTLVDAQETPAALTFYLTWCSLCDNLGVQLASFKENRTNIDSQRFANSAGPVAVKRRGRGMGEKTAENKQSHAKCGRGERRAA